MPLLVWESKTAQDTQLTDLTQALLDCPTWHEEDVQAPGESRESSFSQSLPHNLQQPSLHQHASISNCLRSQQEESDCHSTQHDMTASISTLPAVEFKTLGWLTCPVSSSQEDEVLPTISVYSDPEVCEELQMVIHSNGEGTAQTAGCQLRVSLKSQGTGKPSVATWDGIRIKRAGLYVFEVHSVRQPELNLIWDYPITIVAKVASQSPLSEAGLPEELGGMAKVQMWGA